MSDASLKTAARTESRRTWSPPWARTASPGSNYRRALVHEVGMFLGLTLADPGTVVPVLLRELRASNTIIGLLPSIRFGGWLLPQLFAAGYLQSKERKVPYVVALDLARAGAYVVIALLLLSYRSLSAPLLISGFLVIFGLTRITAGSAMVGRFDVVGKVVPRERMSTFFATRGIWTGLSGLVAGVLISTVLGAGIGFPLNYALLFLTSTAIFTAGALAFALVGEPPGAPDAVARSPLAQLGRVRSTVANDRIYRRYLSYRLLLELMSVAVPFYIVYATDRWGVPIAMTGTYVAAGTAASLAANFVWRHRAQRRGNVSVLSASVLLSALAPLIPLSLALARTLGVQWVSGWVASAAFLLLYVVHGAGNSGREICNNAVLINLAPAQERASYIGLTNTVVGLITLASVLAGQVIDRYGYEPLFALTFAFSLATWWLARSVVEREVEEVVDQEQIAGGRCSAQQ